MWKKAIGIVSILLLVALFVHADDTQASFVSGDTQACFADEFTCNVLMGETSGPIVFSTVVSPPAVINGNDVTLRLSGMELASIVATVTLPDSSQQNITLTDSVNATFHTTMVGPYEVLFTVVDNANRTLTLQRSFEAFTGITMNINIVNRTNATVNATVQFYYNNSLIETDIANGFFSGDVVDTFLDIGFSAYGEQVILRGVNTSLDNDKSYGIDQYQSPGYLVVYGVNNTYDITNATVIIPYGNLSFTDESRLKLLKCDDYDFFNRTCNGAYADINATLDTQHKTLTATVHSFSGFAVLQGTAPAPTPAPAPEESHRRQVCYYNWDCTPWSVCSAGTKTRVCSYTGTCAEPAYSVYHPSETMNCTMPIVPPTPPATPNVTENMTLPVITPTTPVVMPVPVPNEIGNKSVTEAPAETPVQPAVQLPTSTSPWSSKLLWIGLLLAVIIAMVGFVMTQMRKVETRVSAPPRAQPVTMPLAMPARPAPTAPPATTMTAPSVEIASRVAEIERLLGEKKFHEAIDLYERMRQEYRQMTPEQQQEIIALSHKIAKAVGLEQ